MDVLPGASESKSSESKKVVTPKFSEEQVWALKERLRRESDTAVDRIVAAVDGAADGRWIAESEEPARRAIHDYGEAAFQAVLQDKIDAFEASFPPPQETVIDPVTRQPRVKRLRNKGRQDKHVWTVNGSVTLWRRFWHSPQQGTHVPVDARVDAKEQNYTPGVREIACRLNNDGKDFDGTAENLYRAALIRMSGEKMRQIVRREAKRLHFAAASQRVGNVDGALWIRDELRERPKEMPLDGLGLDFYHLGENVARCRRRVYGEKNPQGTAWADDVMHNFKHGGYDPVWSKLLDWRKDVRGRNAKQAADRLLNYVSERNDMIRYPEFQAKGWQIGSGPLESRCKTSTRRLKGSGHRWDPRNAEAVAAHTTLKDSHQWKLYWATQGVETT